MAKYAPRTERFRRIAKTHISLFRRCLPNTYLVVSDDIGNDGAWGDLKRKDPATGELLDDSPIFKYCRELGIELLKPGIYTLAVSVGRKDGKPEIALPLEGGIDRIYPVGKIEVVSKMRGRQFTE